MLQFKTLTCSVCGKKFTKSVGGIVLSQKELELMIHPVCDKCKLSKVTKIFK